MATPEPVITTWLDTFKGLLATVLTERGTIVESRTVYGGPYHRESTIHQRPTWRDREIEQDRQSRHQHPVPAASIPEWCGGWARIENLHEEVRSEFDGTDHDNTTLNLVVATVTCWCGYITRERIEYTATVGELLHQLLDVSVPRTNQWESDDYHRDDRPQPSTSTGE